MTYHQCIVIAGNYPTGTVFKLPKGSLAGIGSKLTMPAYPVGQIESRRMAIADGMSIHVETFEDCDSFHIDHDPILSPLKHLFLDVIPFVGRGAPMVVDLRT